MDVWFCVTRWNRAERHNREVMNTLSETTTRSPERYGKALPHLTKTYHGSRLIDKWLAIVNWQYQDNALIELFRSVYVFAK